MFYNADVMSNRYEILDTKQDNKKMKNKDNKKKKRFEARFTLIIFAIAVILLFAIIIFAVRPTFVNGDFSGEKCFCCSREDSIWRLHTIAYTRYYCENHGGVGQDLYSKIID